MDSYWRYLNINNSYDAQEKVDSFAHLPIRTSSVD